MFVMGSIYLPLWLPHLAGLPITQEGTQIIPLPSTFGWFLIISTWYIFYLLMVKIISGLIFKIKAGKHNKSFNHAGP